MLAENLSLDELVREIEWKFRDFPNDHIAEAVRRLSELPETKVWYTEEEYEEGLNELKEELDEQEDALEAWKDLTLDLLIKLKAIQEVLPSLKPDFDEMLNRYDKLKGIC